MKSVLTVIEFTAKEMIKKKSFIITNIIILAMIVIGFNIPNLIKKFMKEDLLGNTKILIVDKENIFENNLENLNQMELGYEVSIANENLEFDQIKEKIENGDIEEAIIIEKEDNTINMQYIIENATMIEEIPEYLLNSISTIYKNLQISKLDLSVEELQNISPIFNCEIKQTSDEEVNGNVFVMMILSMVLFYAIFFCATQISTSITTEKTSKIIETLVTSISPRIIVLGKTIGVGLVGLLQVIVIATVALISANLFLEKELIESVIDLSAFTPFLAIISIIYFILGYSLYAFIYALTGSTVSKPEDVQSSNAPVAIIAIIGFYLSYFTMMNPTSTLNLVAAILPISSPFCMPFRIMMGLSTNTEIITSIIVMLITIVLIAKISIKVYSNAIINYGSKMSIKEIVKMYKEK